MPSTKIKINGEWVDVGGAPPQITVDGELSSTSVNPVQNKVVKAALDGKAAASHGNHVPTTESANNTRFLRNDNTWQTITPANIGAEPSGTASSLINRATAVNAADTNYSSYMARGEAIFSTETTPTVNGTIAWQYK